MIHRTTTAMISVAITQFHGDHRPHRCEYLKYG
jgi:hypothetical protein